MSTVQQFADELRKWWSFDDRQMHTHSWHSREDFIERKLPGLLSSKWQPIETAPKDGTWILLWDANFQTKHNTPACVGRHNANNVWVNDIHATIKPPTHWMPLPDPPEQSKGGEK